MIALVSADFGGYDDVRHATDHDELFPILVTDRVWDNGMEAKGWNGVYQTSPHLHSRMAAKVPKCRPDKYTWMWPEVEDARTVVWLDASARITDVDAFVAAIKSVPEDEPITQFVHPDRDDITDEAALSATMLKYKGQDVETQAQHYTNLGVPPHWGLWATGMIVYHPHAFDLPEWGNAWLAEQLQWTYQDQISEPYLMWRWGWKPAALPGHLRTNGFVEWTPHTRED